MRIIIRDLTPKEPEGERKRLERITSGTLTWTPKGWDVGGDVIFSENRLKSIPYRFHRVNGNFDVYRNSLFSLEGSPRFVGGHFYADFNSLIDLTGAPDEVRKDCVLSFNNLRSTKGIPRKIGGYLSLNENPNLTSLDDLPDEVGGNILLSRTQIPEIIPIPGIPISGLRRKMYW